MRKPMMAGNWKMNKTVPEALALARRIHARVGGGVVEINASRLDPAAART